MPGGPLIYYYNFRMNRSPRPEDRITDPGVWNAWDVRNWFGNYTADMRKGDNEF